MGLPGQMNHRGSRTDHIALSLWDKEKQDDIVLCRIQSAINMNLYESSLCQVETSCDGLIGYIWPAAFLEITERKN